MTSFFGKAKDFIEKHDEQVDDAVEKAGDMINEKTGGKYESHVDKGVNTVQDKTGEGDTNP
jgi:hypothetical protein